MVGKAHPEENQRRMAAVKNFGQEFDPRKSEIMEDQSTKMLDDSAESRKTRKSDALPIREILEELFDWCKVRFPKSRITVTETHGQIPSSLRD
jgi:hypothetical protein